MTTFVLIHGSYQGGWIWRRVAGRLRTAGHAVYGPTLAGCAERKHQVRGITTGPRRRNRRDDVYEETRRGHGGYSSGGMVLCRAAERRASGSLAWCYRCAGAVRRGADRVVQRSTATPAGPPRGLHARMRNPAVCRPRPRPAPGLARYTLHSRDLRAPSKAESFWTQPRVATVIWCRRAVNPGEAHQPCRGATQGEVVRARHWPLSDCARRTADHAVGRIAGGSPPKLIGDLFEAGL